MTFVRKAGIIGAKQGENQRYSLQKGVFMAKKQSKVTIYDVAEKAGVSPASVSRVLNDVKNVRADVRERVQAAMKELDYLPSRSAQLLKARRSRAILHIVADVAQPAYVTLFRSIRKTSEQMGYHVMLSDAEKDKDRVCLAVENALANHAEGIIISARSVGRSVLQTLKDSGLPVVFTQECDQDLFDACFSDPAQGVGLAMEHLLSLGHTRIAYAGRSARSGRGKACLKAYKDALRNAGVLPDANLVFQMEDSMGAGYRAGVYFTSIERMPTAVYTAGDDIALGVMQAMYERRLRAPEDISVVGEGNSEIGGRIRPALTTVADDTESVVQAALDLLIERAEGIYQGPPRKVLLSNRELIVRESTGPAKKE